MQDPPCGLQQGRVGGSEVGEGADRRPGARRGGGSRFAQALKGLQDGARVPDRVGSPSMRRPPTRRAQPPAGQDSSGGPSGLTSCATRSPRTTRCEGRRCRSSRPGWGTRTSARPCAHLAPSATASFADAVAPNRGPRLVEDGPRGSRGGWTHGEGEVEEQRVGGAHSRIRTCGLRFRKPFSWRRRTKPERALSPRIRFQTGDLGDSESSSCFGQNR